MRVLEATDFYYPWIAGPAPFIRNLSAGLTARGHEVIVACPSPTGRAYTENGSLNLHLHRIRTWPIPLGYQLRAGFPVVDLDCLVRRWQPDIIHIHHPFPISLAALAVGRRSRIPVVATNHTIPECSLYGLRQSRLYRPAHALFSWYIRRVLGTCKAVTTPTATAARMLQELGFQDPIDVISNGVDTERFYPSSSQESRTVPTVLYTGRLDPEKDMDTFLGAISIVLQSCGAHFRIGGEGTDRRRLEQMVHDRGLSEHVAFTGYVNDDELPQVYRGADIYAITSPVELQSIATLEAMASGLPTVAVEAGALPELVIPNHNGFLPPPGDVRLFAEALVTLITKQALRRKMGQESRRMAESHSVDQTVSQYESVFRRLRSERIPRVVCGSVGS